MFPVAQLEAAPFRAAFDPGLKHVCLARVGHVAEIHCHAGRITYEAGIGRFPRILKAFRWCSTGDFGHTEVA